jgi:hypothetical protein
LACCCVVRQPPEDDEIARALAREAQREGDVASRHEPGIVHVKARVRPHEHRLGRRRLAQPAPHEEPEHSGAKGFGEHHDVVRRPCHKGPVGPEAAVDRTVSRPLVDVPYSELVPGNTALQELMGEYR